MPSSSAVDRVLGIQTGNHGETHRPWTSWSLREAAAKVNAYTGSVGLDPGGISSMTAPHLCEHENWPGP